MKENGYLPLIEKEENKTEDKTESKPKNRTIFYGGECPGKLWGRGDLDER